MCVSVFMCLHVRVRVYLCVCGYLCVYVCACACVCVCVYLCALRALDGVRGLTMTGNVRACVLSLGMGTCGSR